MNQSGGVRATADGVVQMVVSVADSAQIASLSTDSVPWDPAVLDRLPEGPTGADPFWRLVAAFLVAYPDATAKAYDGDLKAWPAGVRTGTCIPSLPDAITWTPGSSTSARSRRRKPGRPASPATIARRLSGLSKFYDYGMREVELIEHSPVANVRRPKVSEDSPTIGLDAKELDRLLTAAENDGPRSAAHVSLLVYNGLRIDEALACDVEVLHLPARTPGVAHRAQRRASVN